MEKIRTLIIEDEIQAIEGLRELLRLHCPLVEVVESCESAEKGMVAIGKHQPELIFLDIMMPRINGLDMLDRISPVDFETIFVTGFNEYAIEAIRRNALDYLLKPVDVEHLTLSVRKATEKIEAKRKIESNQKVQFDRVALPSENGLDFIELQEIIRIHSDNNYTDFYLKNGRTVKAVTRNIGHWEELLKSKRYPFYRIHNRHIINCNELARYRPGGTGGGHVDMRDGGALPVSRSRKKEFLEFLGAQ